MLIFVEDTNVKVYGVDEGYNHYRHKESVGDNNLTKFVKII